MKILHIVNVYAPAGGIETYVLDLLPLLEELGYENVLIYRQQHPRMPAINGKPIYHVPVSAGQEDNLRRIVNIIEDEEPAVVYLHDVYDPVLVRRVAQLVPAIGYIHIFYPVCPGLGKLYRRGDKICTRSYGLGCAFMIYGRRCASARHPRNVYHIMRDTKRYLEAYRSLPHIIVASNYMKELMIQNGIEAKRVEILPYFIPMPPGSELKALEPNARDIMFAGRLDYEKGVPYLLEAMKDIPGPHKLIVAGDGSLKDEYVQLAKEFGVADRVQFSGWLSASELKAAYQRCAVTVMPTIMPEPFGKVGVEAMANGRPVVAFDVGGIRDWLKDGYNGFLVPPRDIKQLAARLNQLLIDAELAVELGANGRKYVEQNYSTTQHLEELLRIFHGAVR